jgi:hypothetical protein
MARCFGRIRLTNVVVGRGCLVAVAIAFASAWLGFVVLQFATVVGVAHPAVDCHRIDKSECRRGVVGRS